MMPDAQRDVALAGDALAIAGAEAVLELLGAVVPEQDGEHLEVDDALQQRADALQQIVGIEDASDLARDLVQHGQGLRLPRNAGVEPGVLDRDRHARGGEFQQALMVVGEEAGISDCEVEHADDLVLDDQRDGELGAHGGVGVDVVVDLS